MVDRLPLPSLAGATEWLGSEPLGPAELAGRVVLVNFWTLTCINWIRQAPYVRAWFRAYRDDGLLVVGVHTPEFSFEHSTDRVRRAIRDRHLDYPVAVDNDYAIWSAFDNHSWPALYLADRHGVIRDVHFGEGRYEETERVLQRLLGTDREPVRIDATGVEEPADWDDLRTPEAYLRGPAPGSHARKFPTYLYFNEWALDGEWTIDRDRIVLDRAGGSIACRFQARDAHLVLSPGTNAPIPFQVFLDGEPPGPSHGADVDEQGHGLLDDGRLYQLIREPDKVRDRILEVAFPAPGAEAYVFTFG